jgi:NAD(P)-dependent dehydrogenase (short-subunit alcohol dehydrogenase family)
MTTLVVGATGATGRLLVEQLLNGGHQVRIIVRSPDKIPEALRNHNSLTVVQAGVLDVSDEELTRLVNGCAAVASCLGHVLSLKGIYGQPRRLVTDATRRLCKAIIASRPVKPTKFVLMNTAGNSNRDLHEPVSVGQRMVIGLIRVLLPPHVDNEEAADYLRTGIGRNGGAIEWVVVRPDTLINENTVTEYVAHPSPTRSALFDPGTTSRINVAHFMAELITDEETWNRWKGQMPVVYNKVSR